MVYNLTGSGERIIGDTREKFKAGEIWLIVPGMPHQWIFNPDDTDSEGNIVIDNTPRTIQAFDPNTAYTLTYLLQNAVEHGTENAQTYLLAGIKQLAGNEIVGALVQHHRHSIKGGEVALFKHQRRRYKQPEIGGYANFHTVQSSLL